MKKSSLLIVALSATMAIGTAMISRAAGWALDNGSWVYEDASGYLVYNEWRRGADNLWRYLDGSGRMAVSRWVDDVYYVDENGIMVSGGWKQLDMSSYGETDDIYWYYFLDNGKVVTDAWKKIDNKWYHFNEDGIMETGWVDGDMYFCGDDGAALTGWNRLEPPEGYGDTWGPFDEEDGKKWYYFNTSGKKYAPAETDATYVEKRIDGAYYCFDYTGAMQTGWVKFTSDAEAPIANYRFYGSNGQGITGWYSAEPPADISSYYESDVDWFYFSKSSVPKYGAVSGEARTSNLTSINNKTYLFNELGNPVYGLQKVWISDTEYTAYYFDEISRAAVKGRVDIQEEGSLKSSYYFSANGRGFTGVYSGSLYYMGKLQCAEDGERYQAVNVGGKSYLVNASGRVTKSTSGVKDADGTKYTTDKSGIVIKINDADVSGEVGRNPVEPFWWRYY